MRPVSDLTRNLSANLQAIFKTGTYSYGALIRISGLTDAEVNNILELKSGPTLEVVEIIALTLDCEAGMLLGDDIRHVLRAVCGKGDLAVH
ncbi:hypothetical protein [Sinorhizobium chiapasense]|uniref:Uncharacterized protein n=1 Tax=Sinorhizobium chiapasense TaxID=501572 RepID=A0ABZ2BIX8_9HYPH